MKGLELPVNIIVVIAIAVLVLVALAAFFMTNFWGGAVTIDQTQAFITGCNSLRTLYECKASNVNSVIISGYSPSGTANARCSLGYVCGRRGAADILQCAKLCGCPIYGETGASLDDKCGTGGVLSDRGLGGTPGCPPGSNYDPVSKTCK